MQKIVTVQLLGAIATLSGGADTLVRAWGGLRTTFVARCADKSVRATILSAPRY
jgi:hypothetical protein